MALFDHAPFHLRRFGEPDAPVTDLIDDESEAEHVMVDVHEVCKLEPTSIGRCMQHFMHVAPNVRP